MDTDRKNLYAGIYQTWAWQQGENGYPTRFRIPGDDPTGPLFMFKNFDDGRLWEDVVFDLNEFFATVDLIDDGSIHYWLVEPKEIDKDRHIWLACTEDPLSGVYELTSDWFSAAMWVHGEYRPEGL